jgi:hypothetical protein
MRERRRILGLARSRGGLRERGSPSPTLTGPAIPENAAEVARHIAQVAGELTELATSARLDVLAYLLSMVQGEALSSAKMESQRGREDEP